MKLAIAAAAIALTVAPAAAQVQPGPNLSPSGVPFTFSPRFGYLGPPAGLVPPPPGPPPRGAPLPAPPPGTFATHNGSLMSVVVDGHGGMQIAYADPRPGLAAIGVRPGTVLIRGHWAGPTLQATAVVYAGECGVIPYPVSGTALPNGVLTLAGAAPIVDPYSCAVLAMAWTGNSTLIFEPYVR